MAVFRGRAGSPWSSGVLHSVLWRCPRRLAREGLSLGPNPSALARRAPLCAPRSLASPAPRVAEPAWHRRAPAESASAPASVLLRAAAGRPSPGDAPRLAAATAARQTQTLVTRRAGIGRGHHRRPPAAAPEEAAASCAAARCERQRGQRRRRRGPPAPRLRRRRARATSPGAQTVGAGHGCRLDPAGPRRRRRPQRRSRREARGHTASRARSPAPEPRVDRGCATLWGKRSHSLAEAVDCGRWAADRRWVVAAPCNGSDPTWLSVAEHWEGDLPRQRAIAELVGQGAEPDRAPQVQCARVCGAASPLLEDSGLVPPARR